MGADEPGIGPYLARQRRLRGISLDDLSSRTRIPLRSLERLESGAFDAAPDGFSRSFVRAVAAALGLDADDAVMRLLSEPPPEDESSGVPGLPRPGPRLAMAALALGVAAAVVGWLWLAGLMSSDPPREEPPIVFRPDAVRDLADSAREP